MTFRKLSGDDNSRMTDALSTSYAIPDGVVPLEHLGVIRVVGDDAAAFLHGQLTQDVVLLPDGQARLAAFCSAKGRMLASFVLIRRQASEIWLVCQRNVLATTLKRLSMFVLRAKARLSDASGELAVHGLAGACAPDPVQAWHGQALGDAHVVELYPAGPVRRALWVGPAAQAPAGPALAADVWAWGEVASGVASVGASQADAFVPQMLNYESLGGVNFKKGCYPGQEVVARSQFRGTLKRRTYLAHCAEPLEAGQEVFAQDDAPEQPSGVVLQAAMAPSGGQDALVVLQVASAGQTLHVGSPAGPAITLLPLPYSLLEDI